MRGVVAQELRRVVAHLFQFRQRRQDDALALDALGGFDAALQRP